MSPNSIARRTIAKTHGGENVYIERAVCVVNFTARGEERVTTEQLTKDAVVRATKYDLSRSWVLGCLEHRRCAAYPMKTKRPSGLNVPHSIGSSIVGWKRWTSFKLHTPYREC